MQVRPVPNARALVAAPICLLACAAAQSTGVDPRVDEVEVTHNLGRLCRGGDAQSCLRYGIALDEGRGSTRDIALSTAVEMIACDAGVDDACAWAAVFLSREEHPNRSEVIASQLFEHACLRGHASSCHFSAMRAREGRGRERDLLVARVHADLACEGGVIAGCTLRDSLRDAAVTADASSDGPSLLTPVAIREVVLRHMREVVRCHTQALMTDPRASGSLVLRWVIGGDGAVTEAAVAGELPSPLAATAHCVNAAVRTWRFPPPADGGTVTINYPFRFIPKRQLTVRELTRPA